MSSHRAWAAGLVAFAALLGPAAALAQALKPDTGTSSPAKPGPGTKSATPSAPPSAKPATAPEPPSAQSTVSGGAAAPLPVPPPAVLTMLIRTTLAALGQANYTGNYTVLHGLSTPGMQAASSPADLAIAFTALRRQALDLSPALVIAPELTEPAQVTPQGALRFAGYIPTQPLRIEFAMAFQPVNGVWRIDGLSVSARAVSEATPASGPGAPTGASPTPRPN